MKLVGCINYVNLSMYRHLLAYIEVELEVETEQLVKDASTAKALVQTELQELQVDIIIIS